jgi:hypothetical protein
MRASRFAVAGGGAGRAVVALGCAALAGLAVAGCSTDPCDGQKGACITALVKGTAMGLDRLRVGVDKPAPASMVTPMPPGSLSLPVKFAITLPAGTTGAVDVTIDGLSGTTELAHTSQVVDVPASGRASATFTLNGGSALGPDMATPLDMAQAITIATSGSTSGIELAPLSITITATDPTGGTVAIDVPNLPTGATLTPGATGATATLAWTPGFDQAGSYPLTINVTAANTARNVSQPLMLTIANGADPVFPLNPGDMPSANLPANVVGDFDKDGFADLASCSVTLAGTVATYAVDLLYGDKSGLPTATPLPATRMQRYTFTGPTTTISVASTRLRCVGADVDGDGYSDILLADPGSGTGGQGMVFVVFGQSRANSSAQVMPAMSQTGSNTTSTGTVTLAAEHLGNQPVLVGDYNNDGVVDFATETYPGAGKDSIYIFQGKKPRPADTQFGGGGNSLVILTQSLAAYPCMQRQLHSFGNVAGTGADTILAFDPNAGYTTTCATVGGFTLLANSGGNTTLVRPSGSTTVFGLNASLLCDVDHDGKSDLVAVDGSGVIHIYYAPLPLVGNVLDDSKAAVIMPGAGTQYGALACAPGLVGGNALLATITTPPVRVDVIGTARPAAVTSSLPNPVTPADPHFGESVGSTGDVNGDGKLDLVLGASSGKYWIVYGR